MPQSASPLTGQTLRSYELRMVIGVGGFGVVYQAHQQLLERDVAIKVILPEYADDPEFIRRFESEARIIAHLENPRIVPLYDFWREPGGAYLVMRWLRGGSLRNLIVPFKPLDLTTISHFLDQITEALMAAHESGIVHQDIKPENILLDEYQNAYLADFGIARKAMRSPANSDPDEPGYGTAAYASPEQIMHGQITPQTDIYNLGMMLYELITNRAPFEVETDTAMLNKQLNEPLPLIAREDVSKEISAVLWRATAKKPEDRYPDVMTLAADFRRLVQAGKPTQAAGFASRGGARESAASLTTRPLYALEIANPYKGLLPFSEADERDFFGREPLIQRLLDHLRPGNNTSRFLAVVGASGSGKSSVVQAGLLPRLRRGVIRGFEQSYIAQMHPGATPFEALEMTLLGASRIPVDDLSTQIREMRGGLNRILEQILPDKQADFILVIDQFEEIFTLVKSETERELFLGVLIYALGEEHSRLRLIVTLRADFYDRPLMYEGLGELLRTNTEVVLPLSLEGLQQAITEPARRVGVHLEQGLLPVIIEDVHQQPSALPLLQHALTELYDRRNASVLTLSAYRATGGVVGALAARAEEIYQQLDVQEREGTRQIFLHLVTTTDNSTTSRRVLREELMTQADPQHITTILDAFGRHRLLTFDHDPKTRNPTVQIAHEALIQSWERFKGWISDNQEDLRLRQHLTSTCQEWISANRDPSFLATGSRLSQFEALMDKPALILNQDEQQYLNESIALRRRSVQRLRLVAAAFAVFALIALVLAVFALNQRATALSERDLADQVARIARSRELAVLALTNQQHTDLSLLLSVEALRSANTFEARNSLLTALESRPHLTTYLQGHSDEARSVAFSPDGKLVASGGRDDLILLWNVATGQPVGEPLRGHTGWVDAVAFSPDGKLLASASEDGTIRLWDAASGAPIGQPLTGHVGAVRDVAFSPDGKLLASAGADQTVRLWNVAEGTPDGQPLTGHTDAVWSVAFSPDGKQIASASADKTVRLWDVATHKVVGDPFVGHTNWVLSVAFSPDGQRLASGGADNQIILWDVQRHQAIGQPLTGDTNWVRSIAFSPDGAQLVSGSADHTVRLWDLSHLPQATQQAVYQGHIDAVWSVAFSPDGQTIASAGADHQVILWNTGSPFTQQLYSQGESAMSIALNSSGDTLASAGGNQTDPAKIRLWDMAGHTVRQTLQSPDALITSIAFSPDGKLLASGGVDGDVRLWNVQTASLEHLISLADATTVYSVAFSPDGHLLAIATDSPNVTLWDTATGTLKGTLKGHSDSIYALAFSPDGHLLASGSRDTTIRLWNVDTMQPTGQPLAGHSAEVMAVAFSPDGHLLASGSRDTTIRLWNVISGQPQGTALQGHTDWVTSLAFSRDSQMLASASQDATVRLWDVATGRALGLPLTDHNGWVNSVLFSADNSMLMSAGQDGVIVLRNIGIPSLLSTACQIANRDLTRAEWQQYFPNLDYHATCSDSSLSPTS